MNKTSFNGFLKASADQLHPLQTNIDFIFTDFRPNRNKQGVPTTEAENIIKTGLNMPVKASFSGTSVRGHSSAVPIGPITSMEQRGDQIVGHAIIWKDEFPDLTEYLEQASKSEDGVQFSWELYYKSAEADTDGVKWLQGCLVAGAAIVADPAYAGRTHLLALAEQNSMDLEEMQKQVSDLTEKLWGMLDALYAAMSLPGSVDKAAGIEAQFTTVIESLKTMAEAKASLEAQIEAAKTTTETLETLESEVTELRSYKEQSEAVKAQAELLAKRRADLNDLVTTEEFDGKASFIASLNDEQFAAYAETLKSVVQHAKASVDIVDGPIPDSLGHGRNGSSITRQELAKALRAARSV